MKNIEFARDFIKVCDYRGFFNGIICRRTGTLNLKENLT
jgi:hypothetical protein